MRKYDGKIAFSDQGLTTDGCGYFLLMSMSFHAPAIINLKGHNYCPQLRKPI